MRIRRAAKICLKMPLRKRKKKVILKGIRLMLNVLFDCVIQHVTTAIKKANSTSIIIITDII